MIAPGLAGIEEQLFLWILAALRPGAAFVAAPVFGAPTVPLQLRLVIALAIGAPALSLHGLVLPPEGMMSVIGVVIATREIVLGLALGFAVQIGFAASVLAGEVISNAMGLGFAAMSNPLDGQASPAVGQLLSLFATFLFLGMGGHLMLATIVVDSFKVMPIGQASLSVDTMRSFAQFGGLVFAAGLAIALPVGSIMVMVQIILGIVARATPTLNLFAVGMPAALLAGILLIAMALPVMAEGISGALLAGLEQAARLGGQ